jgi:hypothetical protein
MDGSRVTLRSFFPSLMVIVRVSGFQPLFGIATVIV